MDFGKKNVEIVNIVFVVVFIGCSVGDVFLIEEKSGSRD